VGRGLTQRFLAIVNCNFKHRISGMKSNWQRQPSISGIFPPRY
jgi:hypothetical protein